MYKLFALTLIAVAFSVSSAFAQEYRNFTGSNGRIIEAAFLGFDEATQIVKLRLKDGREQNVKLDLFAPECQQWIKSGGKTGGQQGDDPFGGGDDAPQQELEDGFVSLFDGRSLNGWEGDTNVWRVDQNERTLVNGGRGNLFTRKEYANFIIQLEFRCNNGANNGLMIRLDDTAKQGLERQNYSRVIEIQIADDRYINDNYNGCVQNSLFGPKPVTFYDRNEPPHRGWNSLKVIADGSRITTYINDKKVVDGTLPRDKPFSSIRSGRIGFMGYGGMTSFRNIRIKELP